MGNEKEYKKREKSKPPVLTEVDDADFELPSRMGEDPATFENRFKAETLKRRTRRLREETKEKETRE
jgi:hypothetical protein